MPFSVLRWTAFLFLGLRLLMRVFLRGGLPGYPGN